MSKKNILLGYIFGFITSLSLVILVLLLICKFTISNKNYLIKILDENNYYEEINKEIKEEMELHLLSTGFTDDILKDVYTKEEVHDDILLFFNNVYAGNKTILDKSNVRYNIKINIDDFFKKTKLTVMNKDELNKFVDDLTNSYKDEIRLYGYADNAISKFKKANKLVDIGIISALILLSILVFILVKFIKIKYYGSIIISSGLIILFIRLFVFERVDVDELLIITENISVIIRIILNNLQNIMLVSAIGMIIFGIIIEICNSVCQMEKNKLK